MNAYLCNNDRFNRNDSFEFFHVIIEIYHKTGVVI